MGCIIFFNLNFILRPLLTDSDVPFSHGRLLCLSFHSPVSRFLSGLLRRYEFGRVGNQEPKGPLHSKRQGKRGFDLLILKTVPFKVMLSKVLKPFLNGGCLSLSSKKRELNKTYPTERIVLSRTHHVK